MQSAMVKCNSMLMRAHKAQYNIPTDLSALLGDLRETDLLIISVVLSVGPARCAASVNVLVGREVDWTTDG